MTQLHSNTIFLRIELYASSCEHRTYSVCDINHLNSLKFFRRMSTIWRELWKLISRKWRSNQIKETRPMAPSKNKKKKEVQKATEKVCKPQKEDETVGAGCNCPLGCLIGWLKSRFFLLKWPLLLYEYYPLVVLRNIGVRRLAGPKMYYIFSSY